MPLPPKSDRREWVLEVLDQFEVRLLRYATRLAADEHRGQDAVQQAFLRLCDGYPDELREQVAPWLFTVCRNCIVDQHRKNGRERLLGDIESRGEEADCAANEPDPAALAEAKDAAGRLRLLVAALPAAQREAVDLWSEGFDYRQISQITQRSQVSVRVLVHRGLKRLREHPVVRKMLAEDGTERQETTPSARGK